MMEQETGMLIRGDGSREAGVSRDGEKKGKGEPILTHSQFVHRGVLRTQVNSWAAEIQRPKAKV